jgi:hypothetical protein
MINNRKNDMIVEREIASFFDENLYSNKELFSEFARTDDYDSQIKGSDLILSSSDGKLKRVVVDEKVAITRANTGLETFSLELSFINKLGRKTCGWFLDTSKTTEYYLFGWINKADIPYDEKRKKWVTDEIRKDNINELEWALVSRKKIIKFLEDRGWTLEKLGKQDERIREQEGVKTKEFIDDVSFRYSGNYIERPVNILVKRETYIKLSDFHGIIRK